MLDDETNAARRAAYLKRKAAWREANREKCRAYHKRYRDANRDEINAKLREHQKRPEVKARMRETQNAWEKANRSWANAKARKRYHADVEASRAYCRKKRAAKAAVRRMQTAHKSSAKVTKPLGAPSSTVLYQNAIYAAAHAAVPRGLPSDIRDDVISEIVVAVLCGDILESEIAASAKRFVTAFYRQFDRFKTISLDAPIPGTDGLRLIDTLEAAE